MLLPNVRTEGTLLGQAEKAVIWGGEARVEDPERAPHSASTSPGGLSAGEVTETLVCLSQHSFQSVANGAPLPMGPGLLPMKDQWLPIVSEA